MRLIRTRIGLALSLATGLTTLPTPGLRAEVVAVTVGLDTTCPYGLSA